MRPKAPASPQLMRRSSILSRPSRERSERLIKIATVVLSNFQVTGRAILAAGSGEISTAIDVQTVPGDEPGRVGRQKNGAMPADCMLKRFLDTLFKGDPEAAAKTLLFQQMAGAALLGTGRGTLPQPKAFILFGRSANNGKSEWLMLLERLGGECSHVPPHQMDERNIAIKMRGQLLNTASELT